MTNECEQVQEKIAEIEGCYTQGLVTLQEALNDILLAVEEECDKKLELYKDSCENYETDFDKAQRLAAGYNAVRRFKASIKISILPEGC